jgi:hypothetical protein
MTTKEFNEKWSAHLEPGHYGLALPLTAVVEYLDREFTELATAYPDFRYSQIKSKFNWYSLYATGIPASRIHLIEKEITRLYSEIDAE